MHSQIQSNYHDSHFLTLQYEQVDKFHILFNVMLPSRSSRHLCTTISDCPQSKNIIFYILVNPPEIPPPSNYPIFPQSFLLYPSFHSIHACLAFCFWLLRPDPFSVLTLPRASTMYTVQKNKLLSKTVSCFIMFGERHGVRCRGSVTPGWDCSIFATKDEEGEIPWIMVSLSWRTNLTSGVGTLHRVESQWSMIGARTSQTWFMYVIQNWAIFPSFPSQILSLYW